MRQGELRERARQFARNRAEPGMEAEQTKVECAEESLIEDRDGQPQRYHARVTVRRSFTEMKVLLDAENGQLLNWSIPDHYKGATKTTISEEQAKQLASEVVEIPDDAEIDEMFQETEPDSHITNITWRHVVNDLEVEDDSILLQINSRTHEIASLTKIWNIVTDYECKLTAKDAEDVAEREVPKYVTGEEYEVGVFEQKFIPVVVDSSVGRPKARIIKVWVVNIMEPAPRFPNKTTRLSIDCLTGDIVRVEHSR